MEKKTLNKSTLLVIIVTALITASFSYIIPRIGNTIVPKEDKTINIGEFKEPLRIITSNNEAKPKIVYVSGTFELDGKKISGKKLVEIVNERTEDVQNKSDSLVAYKKLINIYKEGYEKRHDSLFIYKSFNAYAKKHYGVNYRVKKKSNGTFVFSWDNNKKVDSAMVLFRLHGNRLRLNQNNEWFVIDDRDYRRELRKGN